MISVVYRTSLEMFCDVRPYFSQLLKAHVLMVAILGIDIIFRKSALQQKNYHFGVLDSVRQR